MERLTKAHRDIVDSRLKRLEIRKKLLKEEEDRLLKFEVETLEYEEQVRTAEKERIGAFDDVTFLKKEPSLAVAVTEASYMKEYWGEPETLFDAGVAQLYEEIGKMDFKTNKEKTETIFKMCDQRHILYSDLVKYGFSQAAKFID